MVFISWLVICKLFDFSFAFDIKYRVSMPFQSPGIVNSIVQICPGKCWKLKFKIPVSPGKWIFFIAYKFSEG